MDWTSVFVEDGNEDLIIPLLMEKKSTASRLTRLVSKLYRYEEEEDEDEEDISEGHRLLDLDEHHYTESSYSLRAVYYLSINYILGVGCLGIPYAFARAGFLLCSCILLTVTLFSYMTVMWVAETGVRFENQIKRNQPHASEESSLLKNPNTSISHMIEEGRFEVIDLVDFYLGSYQKIFYQISLMTLMYIGLLAYSQVFCGAIGAVLWGTSDGGWAGVPQVIFGLMVVPLCCTELDEQVAIQALMAKVRFVAIFIIAFGSISALWLDDSISNRTHAPYWAPPEPEECTMSYTSCFSGFGVAFSTSLFSQLFQHSVPGLLRPLKEQPEKLRHIPVSKSQFL
jgi:amino acid permease